MTGKAGGVVLIRWPAEFEQRERCRQQRRMRLLVLEVGADPPLCTDVCEDWVRAPVSRDDLRARIRSLLARAAGRSAPILGLDGVLRFDGASVPLTKTETDVLRPLVDGYGHLVTREQLLAHLATGCGGVSRNALDLRVMRLRRRISGLGLGIRTAWGRGYLLEPLDPQVRP